MARQHMSGGCQIADVIPGGKGIYFSCLAVIAGRFHYGARKGTQLLAEWRDSGSALNL